MAFTPHPLFETPERKDVKIWRYLDFTKYVSMLETQSLYFSSARVLREIDPFEGRETYLDVEQRKRFLAAKWDDQPAEVWARSGVTDASMLVQIQRAFAMPSPISGSVTLNSMFINSWHIGDSESAAMWKLYTNPKQGVAIVSTYQKLIDSLEAAEDSILVGKIKYKDFRKESSFSGNLIAPFIQKKQEYLHERELRALIWKHEFMHEARRAEANEKRGMTVPVNLTTLVHEIFVSPLADVWFLNLVKSVTERFGSSFDVKQSDIRADR